MARVLQAMAGARHGGAEAFFTRLAIALEAAGQDQKVVIRRDPQRSEHLRQAGVQVTELKFGGRLDLRSRSELKRLLSSFRPDIVLTWMNRATAALPRGSFRHVARLGGYYNLKYYRHCDHLIGNTPDIVRYLIQEGWPADRAHYLPNFVEPIEAKPLDRSSFETPADAPVLLALGRLHPNKAFDVLLRALTQLPEAYLWLAGEGPELEGLTELARSLGVKDRVRFLGWRDDTADLMGAADLVICPSRLEPLGNVVLEAWAQGIAIVAAAAQGPLQLIEDGVTGLLAAVEDETALARQIGRLLDDSQLRLNLVDNGFEAFAKSFSKAAVVSAYQRFFDKVAA